MVKSPLLVVNLALNSAGAWPIHSGREGSRRTLLTGAGGASGAFGSGSRSGLGGGGGFGGRSDWTLTGSEDFTMDLGSGATVRRGGSGSSPQPAAEARRRSAIRWFFMGVF